MKRVFLASLVALPIAANANPVKKELTIQSSKKTVEDCRLAKDEMECLKKQQAEIDDRAAKDKAMADLKEKMKAAAPAGKALPR